MKARILSITFDKATLPLSPNCDHFEGEISNGKAIFSPLTSVGDLRDYKRLFLEDEIATILGGKEPGLLTASLLKGKDRFKIMFNALTYEDGYKNLMLFDARKYLEEFLHAAEASGMSAEQLQEGHFEKTFSIAYLKNDFAGVIEANDLFWKRLSDDLDTVTAPLNYAVMHDLAGQRPLPVFVDIDGKLVPAFHP